MGCDSVTDQGLLRLGKTVAVRSLDQAVVKTGDQNTDYIIGHFVFTIVVNSDATCISYCAMIRKRLFMNLLLYPWFIALVAIALAHQIAQKIFLIHLPWFDSYLDPLVVMPILFQLVLWERRVIFGRGTSYVLEWWRVSVICIWVAILSEGIFPIISSRFTADWKDVLCYVAGTLAYCKFWNKPDVLQMATTSRRRPSLG